MNYATLKGNSNFIDYGTEGTRIALGTTAQRGSTQGQVRFNSTSNSLEYYDGNFFQILTNAPIINSINVTNIDLTSGTSATTDITISGKNFGNGATVKAIATDSSQVTAGTVVRTSSEELVATFTDSDFTNSNEPYDIKVTNADGQFGTLDNVLYVDTASQFTTPAGSLGTLTYSNGYDSSNLTAVVATDAEGEAITYTISSGTIPSGLTFNSDGTWSGTTAEPASNTTYSFDVRATSNNVTTDRSFTITVNAPQANIIIGYSAGGALVSSYSQSSALAGSTQGNKLYDGNPNKPDEWHSSGGQGWVQLDLNTSIQVYQVKLQNRNDCCNNMSGGYVEGYDPITSTWINLGSVNLGGGSSASQTFTSSDQTTYFTKLKVTSTSSNGGYTSIGEMGVYNKI